MAVLAKDDFDRPDGNLGPNWSIPNGYVIVSKQATPSDLNIELMSAWITCTFPNDQYSQAIIRAMTGTADTSGVGCCVRNNNGGIQLADLTLYRGYANAAGSNNTCIAKEIFGVFTLLAQGTAAWAVGDQIYLKVEGTTLTILRNGEVVVSTSDASLASGYPGVDYSTTMTAAAVDDWEGGDLLPERSADIVFDDLYGDPKSNPQVI